MLPPILVFFIIFSLLVLVHELGHFLVAKRAGIKVEEFGFGYPPRVISVKYGETIYSLNLLPFGGFVRLYGEERMTGKEGKFKRAFFNQSKRVRISVLLAGVIANFFLGLFCFIFIYSQIGIPTETSKVIIAGVSPGSPAEKAGIKADDQIMALNGNDEIFLNNFTEMVKQRAGEEISMRVKRKTANGVEEKEFYLTPRIKPPEGEGAIGVAVTNIEMVVYKNWKMPFLAIYMGVKEALGWAEMIFLSLITMIRKLFVGQLPQDVSGPIGIYQLTSRVSKQGFLVTLQFLAILSINLAILNIMPLPALDGGRILFVVLEKVIGRKIKPKIEQYVNIAGMVFLLGLMILVTVNDLTRLQFFSDFWQRITGYLKIF